MSTIEDRLAAIEASQARSEARGKQVDANLETIVRMLQNVGVALNIRDEIRADLRELNGGIHDTEPAPPPENT